MNFSKNNQKSKFHAKNNFFISTECPFHTLSIITQLFNITFCKKFIGPQRSIGQQQKCNFEFQKFKPDHKKKVLLYIGRFYLQISLEEFWTLLPVRASEQGNVIGLVSVYIYI